MTFTPHRSILLSMLAVAAFTLINVAPAQAQSGSRSFAPPSGSSSRSFNSQPTFSQPAISQPAISQPPLTSTYQAPLNQAPISQPTTAFSTGQSISSSGCCGSPVVSSQVVPTQTFYQGSSSCGYAAPPIYSCPQHQGFRSNFRPRIIQSRPFNSGCCY